MAGTKQDTHPALGVAHPSGRDGTGRRECGEPISSRIKRFALGTAWALKPERLADLLPTIAVVGRHYLHGAGTERLPDPASAPERPDGLLGVCDRLTPELTLAAYARGLFPWSHLGPQKWWAIAQRSTLFFDEYRLEKGVRRALRQKKLQITFDEDFEGVVRACAEPRPGRVGITWIRPQIIDVFTKLHQQGHAHSVEVRDQTGALVGGAYGLAVGKVFFTESQFFRARDASKVGFAVLNQHLQHWGFAMNDAKAHTTHLGNLGFAEVSRNEHNALVERYGRDRERVGRWTTDPTLDTANWQPGQSRGLRRIDVLADAAPSGLGAQPAQAGGTEQ